MGDATPMTRRPLSGSAPDRRGFLRLLASSAALPWLPDGGRGEEDHRIVVILLGGGVRPEDVAGPEAVMPRVAALAEEGATARRARAAAPTSLAAKRAILAGSLADVEAPPAADPRGTVPTVFELLHRQGGLPADALWYVPSGAGASTRLATSKDPESGGAATAIVFAPDRVLGRGAVGGLEGLREGAVPAGEKAVEGALAALLRGAPPPAATTLLAIERFLAADLRAEEEPGPGMADARALRAGTHVWLGAHPRLLVVSLEDAAIGSRSASDYRTVLRRVDAGIGAFMDAVANAPAAARTTSFIVVTDHARAARPRDDALPADPEDRDVMTAFLCACGPAFKRKETLPSIVQAIDVVPTVCHVFGVRPGKTQGRILRRALA